MKYIRLTLIAGLAMLLQGCYTNLLENETTYRPRQGDLIFQSLPRNPLVNAIEGCTNSPYSHCGIIIFKKSGWFVREAIGTVHDTPLAGWILRGRGNDYAVYRLNKQFDQYTRKMIFSSSDYLGRPYDINYDLDDEKIYCSELIYKAWADAGAPGGNLGQLQTLGSLNWQPYEQTIRYIEQGNLPLKRQMITPINLANAPQLMQVYSTY